MSYVFNSTLFDTLEQAHLAIATEWLSAGGNNGERSIKAALKQWSKPDLAAECESDWELAATDEYGGPVLHYYNRDELIEAFWEIERDPAEVFGWDDE